MPETRNLTREPLTPDELKTVSSRVRFQTDDNHFGGQFDANNLRNRRQYNQNSGILGPVRSYRTGEEDQKDIIESQQRKTVENRWNQQQLMENVELLLRKGMDPNTMSEEKNAKPLLLMSVLQKADECTALLLRSKANPVLPSSDGSQYPLDFVDDPKIQTMILDYLPSVSTILDNTSGETVLHRALAQKKNGVLIDNLLRRGADPSYSDEKNRPAFFYMRSLDAAKVVLPFHQKDALESTQENLKQLQISKQEMVFRKRKFNHVQRRKKFREISTHLWPNCVIDLELCDVKGQTLMHYLARQNWSDSSNPGVEIFLRLWLVANTTERQHIRDLLVKTDDTGLTPLEIVITNCIRYLQLNFKFDPSNYTFTELMLDKIPRFPLNSPLWVKAFQRRKYLLSLRLFLGQLREKQRQLSQFGVVACILGMFFLLLFMHLSLCFLNRGHTKDWSRRLVICEATVLIMYSISFIIV